MEFGITFKPNLTTTFSSTYLQFFLEQTS